jgi:hypothetical protein
MWYNKTYTNRDIVNPNKIKDMQSLINRSFNLIEHETKSQKVKLNGLKKMIEHLDKTLSDLQGLPF